MFAVVALIAMPWIAGCNSGSSGNATEDTISGTAATGKPFVGFVSVKGHSGRVTDEIEISQNGRYEVILKNSAGEKLVGPFLIRASSQKKRTGDHLFLFIVTARKAQYLPTNQRYCGQCASDGSRFRVGHG
jgi:hypothetical protein